MSDIILFSGGANNTPAFDSPISEYLLDNPIVIQDGTSGRTNTMGNLSSDGSTVFFTISVSPDRTDMDTAPTAELTIRSDTWAALTPVNVSSVSRTPAEKYPFRMVVGDGKNPDESRIIMVGKNSTGLPVLWSPWKSGVYLKSIIARKATGVSGTEATTEEITSQITSGTKPFARTGGRNIDLGDTNFADEVSDAGNASTLRLDGKKIKIDSDLGADGETVDIPFLSESEVDDRIRSDDNAATRSKRGTVSSYERDLIHAAIDQKHLHDTPKLFNDHLDPNDAFLLDDASITDESGESQLKEILISELDNRWKGAGDDEIDRIEQLEDFADVFDNEENINTNSSVTIAIGNAAARIAGAPKVPADSYNNRIKGTVEDSSDSSSRVSFEFSVKDLRTHSVSQSTQLDDSNSINVGGTFTAHVAIDSSTGEFLVTADDIGTYLWTFTEIRTRAPTGILHIATTAEADAGSKDDVLMTPNKFKSALETAIPSNRRNPNPTASDVGKAVVVGTDLDYELGTVSGGGSQTSYVDQVFNSETKTLTSTNGVWSDWNDIESLTALVSDKVGAAAIKGEIFAASTASGVNGADMIWIQSKILRVRGSLNHTLVMKQNYLRNLNSGSTISSTAVTASQQVYDTVCALDVGELDDVYKVQVRVLCAVPNAARSVTLNTQSNEISRGAIGGTKGDKGDPGTGSGGGGKIKGIGDLPSDTTGYSEGDGWEVPNDGTYEVIASNSVSARRTLTGLGVTGSGTGDNRKYDVTIPVTDGNSTLRADKDLVWFFTPQSLTSPEDKFKLTIGAAVFTLSFDQTVEGRNQYFSQADTWPFTSTADLANATLDSTKKIFTGVTTDHWSPININFHPLITSVDTPFSVVNGKLKLNEPLNITSLPSEFVIGKRYNLLDDDTFQPWFDVPFTSGVDGGGNALVQSTSPIPTTGWQIVQDHNGNLDFWYRLTSTFNPITQVYINGTQYAVTNVAGPQYRVTSPPTLTAGTTYKIWWKEGTIRNQPLAVDYPAGDWTADRKWRLVHTPGVAAFWAKQGQPEPRTLLAFTKLLDGSGIGRSVASSSGTYRTNLQLFNPTFDLDETQNSVGELQTYVTFRLESRSDTGISFEEDILNAVVAKMTTGWTFASEVKKNAGLYSATTKGGVRTGTAVVKRGGTTLGTISFFLARNAANQVGYWYIYEGVSGTYTFSIACSIDAAFLHSDGPASGLNQDQVDERAVSQIQSNANAATQSRWGVVQYATTAEITAKNTQRVMSAKQVVDHVAANAGGTTKRKICGRVLINSSGVATVVSGTGFTVSSSIGTMIITFTTPFSNSNYCPVFSPIGTFTSTPYIFSVNANSLQITGVSQANQGFSFIAEEA